MRLSIIPIYVCDYFRNVIKETTEIRVRENIVRPDMLNLLLEAKKGSLKVEEQKGEENRGFAVADEYNNHHGKISKCFDIFIPGFTWPYILSLC